MSTWPYRLFGLVALAGLTSCTPKIPAPRIEIAGCSAIFAGPTCELAAKARQLRLWLDTGEQTEVTVTVDGTGVAAERQPDAAGGRVLEVRVPHGARRLQVRLVSAEGTASWSVGLRLPLDCPVLAEAHRLREAGELQQALEKLTGEVPARCRSRALGDAARQLLAQNQPDKAAERLREAMRHSRAAGELSGWVNHGLVLAYVLTYRSRDLAAARRLLAELAEPVAQYDEGQAQRQYYLGRLAFELGDLRQALAHLAAARLGAERLGIQRLWHASRQAEADALQTLGRDAEAHAILAELLTGDSLDACGRARLLANIGWVRLRLLIRGDRDAAPEAPLKEVVDLTSSACPDASMGANAHVNLAEAALQRGQVKDAMTSLAAAQALDPETSDWVASWQLDIEARIALARGNAAAGLRLYDRLLAGSAPLSEARWRATVGRAQALERLGRDKQALAVFRKAERLLDEQMRLVPLQAGRSGFLRGRQDGTERFLAMLVGRGRAQEALAVARISRARTVWAVVRLDQVAALPPAGRQAWDENAAAFRAQRDELARLREALRGAAVDEQAGITAQMQAVAQQASAALDRAYQALPAGLPRAESLREPEPGELLLVYHPLASGWLGLAATSSGTTAEEINALDLADPQGLSRALLKPFAEAIERAERITILPSGALAGVDFHALPWRDAPLVARAPVAYALDLPARSGLRSAARQALVVADPTGDLRGARQDAALVSGALEEAELLWQAQATRAAVLQRLGAVGWLHYSGHADFGSDDGFASTLRLAGSGHLTAGDILAQPAVPSRVVLAACDSGRAGKASAAQTLGLGQAFVAAGSREVVAASRSVDDRVASQLSTALYAASSGSLCERLRTAQLQLRASCLSCDWAAFSVLVP